MNYFKRKCQTQISYGKYLFEIAQPTTLKDQDSLHMQCFQYHAQSTCIMHLEQIFQQMWVSSIITTVSIWHYCMNRDFEDFVKLDTVDSNLARKYIQNISKKNVIFPYFEKETVEIIQKRQEQEKEK